jgi:hypothetical protein
MRSFTPQAAQYGSLPAAYRTFLRFGRSSELVNMPKRLEDYMRPSRQFIKPSFPQRAWPLPHRFSRPSSVYSSGTVRPP